MTSTARLALLWTGCNFEASVWACFFLFFLASGSLFRVLLFIISKTVTENVFIKSGIASLQFFTVSLFNRTLCLFWEMIHRLNEMAL